MTSVLCFVEYKKLENAQPRCVFAGKKSAIEKNSPVKG